MKQLIPFLNKIIASGNEPDAHGCWNWQGATTSKTAKNPSAGGYGCFSVNGRTRYAHNLSYLLFVVIPSMGKSPSDFTDKQILTLLDAMKGTKKNKNKTEGSHLCPVKNRGCVNPLHQKRESHSENHKRSPNPGGNRKLSDEQVREIRRLFVGGQRGNRAELAKKYGVNPKTIWGVATRRRCCWKHIQ